MEKKLTRRESRETAFLTAFAATFEPEEPTVPAEEHAAPDAFANQLLAAMNDHAAELDEIITAHLKGNRCKASRSDGTTPPNSVQSIRAMAARLRALLLG